MSHPCNCAFKARFPRNGGLHGCQHWRIFSHRGLSWYQLEVSNFQATFPNMHALDSRRSSNSSKGEFTFGRCFRWTSALWHEWQRNWYAACFGKFRNICSSLIHPAEICSRHIQDFLGSASTSFSAERFVVRFIDQVDKHVLNSRYFFCVTYNAIVWSAT